MINITAQPTVLQRIATELMARLGAMKDEDNEPLWNNIYEGDTSGQNMVATPYVTIIQGPEETTDLLWPQMEKTVTFYLEFHWERFVDLDNTKVFRYYLGRLQRVLFKDQNARDLGGLSRNVYEVGSNPQIEGQSDAQPSGSLTFNVIYRHMQGDPYHLISETNEYA